MIGKTIVLGGGGILLIAGIGLLRVDESTRGLLTVIVLCACVGAFVAANACLTVKRWHDRNKSGGMYFIVLIPYIGLAWTLIECGFIDGTQGRNRYGKSPKGVSYSTPDMKFVDLVAFKKQWFALGVETYSGQHYLAIPVNTLSISYDEFYRLDDAQFEVFKNNVDAGMAFADTCRNREMDHLLMIPPPLDRGVA